MTENQEHTRTPDPAPERSQDDAQPIDADESGTLAIGLMVAIVAMVAMLTLGLFISIP